MQGTRMDPQGGATVAGVELGGTKCIATLARGREILAQERVPTTRPDETLPALAALLDGWWRDAPFAALGVASFGPIDLDLASPTYGSMTSTTKLEWVNAPVLPRLAGNFPVPLGFDTDVNGAAMAEMLWGAGRGLASLAYITVGTGIGVGLIVDGKPVLGFTHAELGHLRVARMPGDDWPGACPYHGGCVEGLASGPAIAARLGGRPAQDIPADDPVWETVAHALAQLCHALVCTTAPERILVGGGVAGGQPQLLARIEPLLVESLAGYVRLPGDGPYVTRPGLGDDAGPLGPIALAHAALAVPGEAGA